MDKQISTSNWIVTTVVGLIIFSLAYVVAGMITDLVVVEVVWLNQVLLKTILLVTSLVLIIPMGITKTQFLGRHGFNWSSNKTKTWLSFSLGAILSLIIIVAQLTPIGILKEFSFIQIILVIWIWSSLAEEIFARGLIQAIVKDEFLITIQKKLTIPMRVGVSAIVFCIIHFSIFIDGGALSTTIITMSFMFLLGLLTGMAKENGNVLSSVFVHLIFNIGGLVGGIVGTIIKTVINGS